MFWKFFNDVDEDGVYDTHTSADGVTHRSDGSSYWDDGLGMRHHSDGSTSYETLPGNREYFNSDGHVKSSYKDALGVTRYYK